MTTIRGGIHQFLKSQVETSPYLIPLYSPNLETQVMVHEGHTPSETGKGWSDGGQNWGDQRWPYNSNTVPSYSDRQITFSPVQHCKLIGTSWWDYVECKSIGIGLDIDTEEGHAATTTTVTGDELEELIERILRLPYVTVVRSKSGQGVHIYVFFSPLDLPNAANHNEHKRHAIATLNKMSEDMGYDLSQHVDAKGNIFWLWADTVGDGGFQLIREHQEQIGAKDLEKYYGVSNDVPDLVGYNKSGVMVKESTEGMEEQKFPLDETHKEILKELEDSKYEKVWIEQFNMFQTSTYALKELFERRAVTDVPIKGRFDTVSTGKDTKRNCYITPRQDGSFKVVRFGGAVSEHDLWTEIDGKTCCYFNQPTNHLALFKKLATKVNNRGRMTFELSQFARAMKSLGHNIGEARMSGEAPVTLALQGDGTFLAESKGWESPWILPVVHAPEEYAKYTSADLELADKHVRHMISESGVTMGWAVKWKGGWINNAKESIATNRLQAIFGDVAEQVKNQIVDHSWSVIDEPFKEEYPGDRVWNKDAVRFKVEPSESPGPHPHWDLIMDHLGTSLNRVVESEEWCQRWGIHNGADYLRAWVSCLVKHPFDPLPYLFFFGQQETGKSMFHEMMRIIFTGGVCRANGALTNKSEFNGELNSAIVGYVEEMDLSKSRGSYEKIKELTTAREMFVHIKGMTPYPQRNKLHFVQMGNSSTDCPIEEGDRRIVVIEVPRLKNEIGKNRLERELEKEAPFFLTTLLDTYLPEPINRLRLPILGTAAKEDLEVSSRSDVHAFMAENVVPCDGHSVPVGEAYERYRVYCAENSKPPKSAGIFRAELSPTWEVGRGRGNKNHIANVSFDKGCRPKKDALTLAENGRLK